MSIQHEPTRRVGSGKVQEPIADFVVVLQGAEIKPRQGAALRFRLPALPLQSNCRVEIEQDGQAGE